MKRTIRAAMASAPLALVFVTAALLMPGSGAATMEAAAPVAPPPQDLCPSGGSTEAVCPVPRVSIWASPNPVNAGGSTTLSWTTENAWNCVASGGWSGTKGTIASEVVGPINAATRFTLTCTNDNPTAGVGFVDVGVTSSPPPPPPPPPNSCSENIPSQLASQYVAAQSSVVPTSVVAGQTFSAQITFKNTGQCTWTAASGYKLGSQSPENNTNWGTDRVLLGAGDSIAPGQSKTFTLNATAPSTPGTYGFSWRMVREGINWFGLATPNVAVNVTSAPPPPTGCDAPDPSIKDYAICTQFADVSGAAGPGQDLPSSGFGGSVSPCPAGSIAGRRQPFYITWKQPVTGLLHWKYNMQVTWCWNATRITYVERTRWPEKGGYPLNPWGFDGHVGSNCDTETCGGKAKGTSQRIMTSGKFSACALKVVFCNSITATIEVEIRRGGGFSVVRLTW